jgi:3'-5' exoribonuclease
MDRRLAELQLGDAFEGFYVLKAAQQKTSQNGKPFLNATLSDATGAMDAKVWDYPGPLGAQDAGSVVRVRGTVGEFRGALQLTIERIRLADEHDEYDPADLVPVAPIDADAAMGELAALLSSLEDADYRAVAQALFEKHEAELRRIPAAKSVHHGFLGGLLMHTLNMMRLADFLARLYAPTADRSLLLAGTFLHDLGKTREFCFSPLGLVTDYSAEGELLGHLVLGAQEAAETARALGVPEEKSMLLQHLILSHHGDPEFGAAVVPQCAESELLALIDRIDSRMEIYRETLEELQPGDFSQRIFALEKRVYKHE